MVLLWNNLKPWPLEAPFPGTSVFCSVHCLWGLAGRQRTSSPARPHVFQRTPAIHPKPSVPLCTLSTTHPRGEANVGKMEAKRGLRLRRVAH